MGVTYTCAMAQFLRRVFAVVIVGVLVAWLADGLDPICGPQRCSGVVTPYAITLYHDHALPWAMNFWQDEVLPTVRWWQNDDNQTLMLVCLLTLLFGVGVAAWGASRAKTDQPYHFVGGALIVLAAFVTAVVRGWNVEAIQAAHPDRWLIFALLGVPLWLCLKAYAVFWKGSEDYENW